jgi:hypothetical protein
MPSFGTDHALVGWLSFPLAFRLLPSLADRGYAAPSDCLGYRSCLAAGDRETTPAGCCLPWRLSSFERPTVRRDLTELKTWWRKRRSLVLGIEALFLLAFAGMALVRAADPELNYTEKPMELAFINAIDS